MAISIRLLSDSDFQEAMERQVKLKIFRNDLQLEAGSTIARFDHQTVVVQAGVSELTYYKRNECEFFEHRTR